MSKDGLGAMTSERGIARAWVQVLLVVALVLASRLAYVPKGIMGGDGPAYVNALKLDETFSVPPPGNIGYVLAARAIMSLAGDPVVAYALVGTLLSCVGGAFMLLLARLLMPVRLALATTLALMASVQVWYHGVIMQSYIVWLAALPTIAYFGLRLVRERSWSMLAWAAGATGLSTILRPDLVVFGGPLLGACLLLARVRWTMWAAAAGICAVCCLAWLLGTASVLGSLDRYLELVRHKHEWHETYGVQNRGLVEGLGRNVVKYAVFIAWSAHLAIPLCAWAVFRTLARLKERWRGVLVGLAWVGPSLYFSWIIFMGNAGLILVALPLVYLGAARALAGFASTGASVRRATIGMSVLAVVNAAQFVLTPIPEPTDQRRVLLTHMFFGYSGTGIRRTYTYELQDFGIDKSLKNTAKQFWNPEPVPRRPGK